MRRLRQISIYGVNALLVCYLRMENHLACVYVRCGFALIGHIEFDNVPSPGGLLGFVVTGASVVSCVEDASLNLGTFIERVFKIGSELDIGVMVHDETAGLMLVAIGSF